MKIIRHKTYKVEFICGGMQLTERIKARDAETAQQQILEKHSGGEPG